MSIPRQIVHRIDMTTEEVLRSYVEGFRLTCRYCKVEFETIPAILLPGERPSVVTCPNNRNHMSILTEPARVKLEECPRCAQGAIRAMKIKANGQALWVCDECEATWSSETNRSLSDFKDLGQTLEGFGLAPLWSALEPQ
jgi:ribosomal protein L37AE/L43A